MAIDDLINRLSRYSKKCIAERLDEDFAMAVWQVKGELVSLRHNLGFYKDRLYTLAVEMDDCRNELCQKCGKYKDAHGGACDGCRWYDANEEE